jgi:hypothetical protein
MPLKRSHAHRHAHPQRVSPFVNVDTQQLSEVSLSFTLLVAKHTELSLQL